MFSDIHHYCMFTLISNRNRDQTTTSASVTDTRVPTHDTYFKYKFDKLYREILKNNWNKTMSSIYQSLTIRDFTAAVTMTCIDLLCCSKQNVGHRTNFPPKFYHASLFFIPSGGNSWRVARIRRKRSESAFRLVEIVKNILTVASMEYNRLTILFQVSLCKKHEGFFLIHRPCFIFNHKSLFWMVVLNFLMKYV